MLWLNNRSPHLRTIKFIIINLSPYFKSLGLYGFKILGLSYHHGQKSTTNGTTFVFFKYIHIHNFIVLDMVCNSCHNLMILPAYTVSWGASQNVLQT